MLDTYYHKGLRQNLVDEIRIKGINDENVLSSILKVPRHLFMDNAFVEFAYQDKAFPISCDQTISQPYTVAYQTKLLDLKPYEKVLEIGTGSGYQTAILSNLKAQVFTIERQKKLYLKAKKFLPSIGYTAFFIFGDGYKGLPKVAPFDKIIITCGAPYVPEELLHQLKIGGKLVAPIGTGKIQKMTLVQRNSEKKFSRSEYGNFSFVPMLTERTE
tara:strand:- start:1301 stop:1945 length:645 start_codon:yes stop_codon:yes gene_type:complete